MDSSQKFSKRAIEAQSSIIDELFRLLANSQVISFASGAPDTALFPLELFTTLTQQAGEKYGKLILQYGNTKGFLPLREVLPSLLTKRGITCTPDDIHVSTGASGGLNNVCMVFLDKGDIVLAETPTYLTATKVFTSYGAKVISIGCDKEGIVPAKLEKALQKTRVKCVYLMPTFQNPTGKCMSYARREEIAQLVKKYNALIIEDDVYYELRYNNKDIPTMHSFAPQNTIYIGSFSKVLAPAVRIGYVIAPKDILEKVILLKQGIDMQTSTYMQALMTEYVVNGHYDPHIEMLKGVYAKRRDIMMKSIKTHMPKGFSWSKPNGGMFIWGKGSATFDATKLVQTAIDQGVAFIPGNPFFVKETMGKNSIRLNFASAPDEQIDPGIAILASVFKNNLS